MSASEAQARNIRASRAAQVAFPEAIQSVIDAMEIDESVLHTGVGPGGSSGVSDEVDPIFFVVTNAGVRYVDAFNGGETGFIAATSIAGQDGSPLGDGSAIAECYDQARSIIFRVWFDRDDGVPQAVAFAEAIGSMKPELRTTRWD